MTERSAQPPSPAARRPIAGPANRETFLSQQARYRRETWRLSALCAFAVLGMGVPLSIVISPFVWSLAIVGADLVNLVQPAPNLFRLAFDGLDRVLGGTNPPSTRALVWLAAGLVVPGIAFMAAAWLMVRSLLFRAGSAGMLLALGAREPAAGDFEEKQVVDIVEEMAIAAGLRPPQVRLLDVEAVNAGALGTGPDDAVVLVSRGLLGGLDRDETEGVIGELIASIGNGDLRASMTILSVVQTLGLVSMLLGAPFGRKARAALGHLLRLMVTRGDRAQQAEQVRALLIASATEGVEDLPDTSGKARLRDVVELPFIMGQAAFWMNQKVWLWLLAGPLIAIFWRARRYLADATAVQLTRYPDGLARALVRLATQDDVIPGAGWSSHLFVVGRTAARDGRRIAEQGGFAAMGRPSDPRAARIAAALRPDKSGQDNPIDSLLSFDPPLRRRLSHLVSAGATIVLPPAPARQSLRVRLIVAAILGPILALVVVVLLGAATALVFVALAIYMLFLLPMVGAVHLLLHRVLPGWLGR